MANLEIKNIVDTEVIESPTGEENLLVEASGVMKRIPSSNFSGGGGGSGSGFDITGKIVTHIEVIGGELIEMDPITISYTDLGHEPTAQDIFGDDLNQANVYTREVTVTDYAMTLTIYGYYHTDDWEINPDISDISDRITTTEVGVLSSDFTFAELKEANKNRPITASIAWPQDVDGMRIYMAGEIIADMSIQAPGLAEIKTIGDVLLKEVNPGEGDWVLESGRYEHVQMGEGNYVMRENFMYYIYPKFPLMVSGPTDYQVLTDLQGNSTTIRNYSFENILDIKWNDIPKPKFLILCEMGDETESILGTAIVSINFGG